MILVAANYIQSKDDSTDWDTLKTQPTKEKPNLVEAYISSNDPASGGGMRRIPVYNAIFYLVYISSIQCVNFIF